MKIEAMRQVEAGAPFEKWEGVELVREGRLFRLVKTDPMPEALAAYRFVIQFPLEGAVLHHAAFVRMNGRGSFRFGEDPSEADRSPLTASYHFDERLGAQSFGLFPPLVVLRPDAPGLLVGAVTEDRDRFSLSWGGSDLEVQFDLWGLQHNAPQVEAGFQSELIYVEELPPGLHLHPSLFDGYRQAVQGSSRRAHLTQDLFWGSWNDGHFRDIDETRILATADWLKENLPNATWIQIDDGWGNSPEMSDFGFFYKPMGDDPRFPDGLGGLARKIKEKGLRPMIWLTPSVTDTSPLYLEHPEWFLEKTRLHFVPEMRFLDFSKPEAMDYARRAFDLVFREWGYEGCKLDFWSMGFDQSDIRLEGSQTSMEAMHRFLSLLREYVGEDGILLYGIDLPFGSPMRARYFDQFRYYADSEGSCQSMDAMREQALWAAFLVGLYEVQRHFWVPDGDGLGMFDHFTMPNSRFRLWGSFLLGSGTLTELAGWLHEKRSKPRLQEVVRFARHARLGNRVTLPGYDYLAAQGNAPFVWVRHDTATEKLIAVTNWSSSTYTTYLEPGDLELPEGAKLKDILTDEIVELPATIEVGAEDGRAFVTL